MPRGSDRARARTRRGSTAIHAAGGLLWRRGARGPLVAIVHRPRYDDWALPKGKLDPNEAFAAAAVREVREETGCEATPTDFAGVDVYPVSSGTKVVLYWNMRFVRELGFEPNDEIDAVAWLTVAAALKRLDHRGERELLRDAARRAGRIVRGS